jgi:predicted nucleic acid-binding protein
VALYLADSSIWSWADRQPRSRIAVKLVERLERGEVATCSVVVLESLHRARGHIEFAFLFETFFEPLPWLPITPEGEVRAISVQRELAVRNGNHRRPAADFLIAAVAERAASDVQLWFYDKDLKVICEHTGQPHDAEKGP